MSPLNIGLEYEPPGQDRAPRRLRLSPRPILNDI